MEVHATNAALFPCFSFATSQLGMEALFGETPMQKRFKIDDILASGLGRQIGVKPFGLCGILRRETPLEQWKDKQRLLTRTMLATYLVNGITPKKRIMDEADWDVYYSVYLELAKFQLWLEKWEFMPYWKNKNIDLWNSPPLFLVSSYYNKDENEALLVISNMLERVQNVNLTEGVYKPLVIKHKHAVDVENGEQIDLKNIQLPKFDFKIIHLKN